MGDNAELEQEIWPKEWQNDNAIAGLKFKAKSQPKKQAYDFSVQARYGLPKAHEQFGFYSNLTWAWTGAGKGQL